MTYAVFNEDLEQKAIEFHQDNPHVYELFKELCFRGINGGRTTLSAAQIWEVMRWEYSFQTSEQRINPLTDEPLKLSNNHRTYYARWFMAEFPQYDGIFKTKHLFSRD